VAFKEVWRFPCLSSIVGKEDRVVLFGRSELDGGKMKKLTENARCEPTYMERPERMKMLECKFEESETGLVEVPSWNSQREYKLSLTVGTTFWCTKAAHERVRREAERLLVRGMFNDSLMWIQRCRTAIVEHDPEAALFALGCLEEEIIH
jgi:hypothetical protein